MGRPQYGEALSEERINLNHGKKKQNIRNITYYKTSRNSNIHIKKKTAFKSLHLDLHVRTAPALGAVDGVVKATPAIVQLTINP